VHAIQKGRNAAVRALGDALPLVALKQPNTYLARLEARMEPEANSAARNNFVLAAPTQRLERETWVVNSQEPLRRFGSNRSFQSCSSQRQ
jgi:hypothetical protein